MSEQAVVALSSPLGYLEHLMARVPGVIANSVAASMAKGYGGHWSRWTMFAQEHGVAHLPAEESHLCEYFIHLCDTSKSLGPALAARSAIGN